MKKLFLFHLILFICTLTLSAQNQWTVSPTTDFAADFPSIAAACASSQVQAGDILLVNGGTYGNDTISKSINIIGTGYFLGTNGIEDLQATTISAQFDNLEIEEMVSSIYVIGVDVQVNINIYGTDIAINRCRTNNNIIMHSTCETITVEQCYIQIALFAYSTSKNINVNNSYIGASSSYSFRSGSTSATIGGSFNGIVKNCVIGGLLSIVNNVQFQNNIFTYPNSFSMPTGGYFTNNIFVSTLASDTGSGNQQGIALNTLFVGATNNSTDGQWQLAENSPAVGAGMGGTDCGMFGGDTPYVLSGLPGIPNIYSLTTPNTGNNAGMNVEVKVKTNN